MKTMRRYIIPVLAVWAVLNLSCSKENRFYDPIENSEECLNSARASVDDFVFDNTTKAAISNVGAFTWTKSSDKIGVWPTLEAGEEEVASQVQFKAIAGGSSTVIFSGSGWGLMPNRKYFAYYPYKESAKANLFSGTYGVSSTQTANNSTSHLSSNIILYTSATAPAAKDTAEFRFHHLGSIMKMEILVSEENKDKTMTQVTISTADALFTRGFTFNPCADVPTVTATSKVSELTLKLGSNGAGFKPVDGKISVWFLIGPVDLSGQKINVTLGYASGQSEYAVQGVNQESGKAHLYELASINMWP